MHEAAALYHAQLRSRVVAARPIAYKVLLSVLPPSNARSPRRENDVPSSGHAELSSCKKSEIGYLQVDSGSCKWFRAGRWFRASTEPYCLGGVHPDFSPIYVAFHLLTVVLRCRCTHSLEHKLHVRKQSDKFRRGNNIQEAYRNLSELTDKGVEDTLKTGDLKTTIIRYSIFCIFG